MKITPIFIIAHTALLSSNQPKLRHRRPHISKKSRVCEQRQRCQIRCRGFSVLLMIIFSMCMRNYETQLSGNVPNVVNFMEFAQIYRDDLPEINSLKAEVDIWETYWLQKFSGKLPDHISTTLKETMMMKTTFPNIYTALCILGTILITTVSVNVRYLLCVV